MSTIHEQNRRSWNAVTEPHNSHKVNQAQFLREGGSTLFPEELELLGPLGDQELLHLQCNCGQDTLSLVGHGCHATGIDIADEAIAFATKLSEQSRIPATFEREDVLQWLPRAAKQGRRFDRVFCSYGTIGWIEDLQRYVEGIASVLRPGGCYVLLEFHPLVWSLGPEPDSYFIDNPIDEKSGVRDYVGLSGPGLTPSGWADGVRDFENPERAVSFQWTVADIINAVISAKLELEVVREYPFSNGCRIFDAMTELEGKRFTMPTGQPTLPLMLGLRARKPLDRAASFERT